VPDRQLLDALGAARRAVDNYVATRRRQGASWDEEVATQLLCMAAYPRIEAIEFTRHQERLTGADWLWWWVDSSDECFGMLAQAKKPHRRGPSRWFVDFLYPDSSGRQMDSLFRTADELEVAPAYVLYAGDVEYRAGLACGKHHSDEGCARCERSSVSILAALAAREVVRWSALSYPGQSAVDAFHRSLPIEDLGDPDRSRDVVVDVNLPSLSPALRSFLGSQQSGARQVAKMIFNQLSLLRSGQFTAVAAPCCRRRTGDLPRAPRGRRHFGIPYLPHILRALRIRVPDYLATSSTERVRNGSLTS